jgi:uncharacterized protein with PIN domain
MTEVRFLADRMVGRLARWLRMLGYDTAYPDAGDAALVRQARAEGRILLTRDTRLCRRRDLGPHCFIESDQVMDQLRQVLAAYRLQPGAGAGRRCARCNAVLEPVGRAEVAAAVPAYVLARHAAYARCPACGRLYWPGSHWQRIQAAVERLCA